MQTWDGMTREERGAFLAERTPEERRAFFSEMTPEELDALQAARQARIEEQQASAGDGAGVVEVAAPAVGPVSAGKQTWDEMTREERGAFLADRTPEERRAFFSEMMPEELDALQAARQARIEEQQAAAGDSAGVVEVAAPADGAASAAKQTWDEMTREERGAFLAERTPDERRAFFSEMTPEELDALRAARQARVEGQAETALPVAEEEPAEELGFEEFREGLESVGGQGLEPLVSGQSATIGGAPAEFLDDASASGEAPAAGSASAAMQTWDGMTREERGAFLAERTPEERRAFFSEMTPEELDELRAARQARIEEHPATEAADPNVIVIGHPGEQPTTEAADPASLTSERFRAAAADLLQTRQELTAEPAASAGGGDSPVEGAGSAAAEPRVRLTGAEAIEGQQAQPDPAALDGGEEQPADEDWGEVGSAQVGEDLVDPPSDRTDQDAGGPEEEGDSVGV